MRVLHLGKFYPPAKGGIESVLASLCTGASCDIEPEALVVNTSPRTVVDTIDGVRVIRVGSRLRVGSVSLAPALPWRLARGRADLLVLHEPNPMALLAYVLARPPMPLVVWYHSEVIRPRWRYATFYRPFLDFALRRAARIVVASPPMRDVPALAPYRKKTVVVPYGVDVDRYRPTRATWSRGEAVRAKARRQVLFVGRLVRYKGVEVLLRAMTGVDGDLVVVGEGPLRPTLRRMADGLGLGTRARFVGDVPHQELVAWYHASDLLVLPSVTRQEAFGLVQVEAMLCGRPVVSTDLGVGTSWVNQDGLTGLTVRPNDPVALRAAIGRILGDDVLRRRLGAAGLARARALFTSGRMCTAMDALCRAVRHESPRETSANVMGSRHPDRVSRVG